MEMTHDGEAIEFIEYHDGRPFQVFTSGTMFDFDWCKRDGVALYRNAGGGGPYVNRTDRTWRAQYWVAPGVEIVSAEGIGNKKPLTERQLRARGFDRIAEPINGNPFDDAIESESRYCKVCDDHYRDSDECVHLRWVYDGNGMAGCGSERDADEHKRAFSQLLAILPRDFVSKYAEALRKNHQRVIRFEPRISGIDEIEYQLSGGRGLIVLDDLFQEDFDGLDGEEGELALGVAWMASLNDGRTRPSTTADADAITLKWIEEFLAMAFDAPAGAE